MKTSINGRICMQESMSLHSSCLLTVLTAVLGPRSVLPMCVFYCSVHFGKPLLESCSAIFGGYILGILAYKTKHIWGGVCAHLGIAFMMEIMGLIHLFTRL